MILQKRENVKLIKDQFNQYGWKFKLLKRDGNVVLYQRSIYSYDMKETIAYEVHIIREVKTTYSKKYEYREKLASASDFGKLGWGYGDLALANAKYIDLVNQSTQKSVTISKISNDHSVCDTSLPNQDTIKFS